MGPGLTVVANDLRIGEAIGGGVGVSGFGVVTAEEAVKIKGLRLWQGVCIH